jgi:undecaprenyl-phosphate 4-deoxy-4-formamido-L-arabinose transferase
LPILVLSVHDEVHYAERVLRAGANGYLMKQEATGAILDAVRRVEGGAIYLTPRAAKSFEIPALPDPDPGHGRCWLGQSVSIVIPVYNAAGTVEALGESLIRELSRSFRLQLILVDDGSEDQSVTVCRRLQARFPEIVELVCLSRNFGEQAAVMAGLQQVVGDYCVIMDDDLQNPPQEVWHLLREIRKGYDVVYASYRRKQHPLWRNLGSGFYNRLAGWAIGKPRPLYLASFKVLSRFLIDEINRRPVPEPHIDALILQATRRIGVVTVRHDPRRIGRSAYTPLKLLRILVSMCIGHSLLPVRICALTGLSVLSIGGISWGGAALMGVENPFSSGEWIRTGLIVLAVSLAAEYAGRAQNAVHRTPPFVIREHHPRNGVNERVER